MSTKPPTHCGISHLDQVTQQQQASRQQQAAANKAAGSKSIDAAARQVIKTGHPKKGAAK